MLLNPTGELRFAECGEARGDEPVVLDGRNDNPFRLQQAWVDLGTGQKVWRNVPTVWMGDPSWGDGAT